MEKWKKIAGMEKKIEKKLKELVKVKYNRWRDKEKNKFYVNDKIEENTNDIRVGMIDRSIEVENKEEPLKHWKIFKPKNKRDMNRNWRNMY